MMGYKDRFLRNVLKGMGQGFDAMTGSQTPRPQPRRQPDIRQRPNTPCDGCAGLRDDDKNRGNGKCSNCGGSGERRSKSKTMPITSQCLTCKGSGNCNVCEGSGKQPPTHY